VAVAFDVTHTLDLNGLAGAYDRIAAAKAMRKTAPGPGSQTIEPTLGVIFATDSTVPLEELADELERLVVVATKGQISSIRSKWSGPQKLMAYCCQRLLAPRTARFSLFMP
jgi:hypothetical protein